ncbi:uncharacterized protein [Macrobrachium rosenbergii]|uniref:uncharacterized protein n=1 Tax=Macrobrachium rosenbergii TaxID=79674 RepID=UPI0034D7246E
MSHKLVACMLNVSEARNKNVVEKIAGAALSAVNPPVIRPVTSEWRINASVLNIFRDYDYNRSVITVVSNTDLIGASLEAACKTAYDLIDLKNHEGVHPRLGAVDLVPLHPITETTCLESLGRIAVDLAGRLTATVPGTSAFLFGTGDPENRGLVQRRKEVGWFRKPVRYEKLVHDLGAPPSARYGLTGIGAIPYMMNVNVTLDTDDIALGRRVAAAIRATSANGLPGVQAMAFPHEGRIEVACNVDLLPAEAVSATSNMKPSLGGKYFYTPAEVIRGRILAEAGGVQDAGTILVGFTPEEALSRALHALTNAHAEAWKMMEKRMM